MTKEELAEEYKVKFLEVYKLTTPGLLTESEIDNYNRGLGIGYEYGFLAGIEAGKLQWHDLRKNPNDLPYVSGFYLVSKSCWDGCYTHVHYFNKGGNESGHWDVNVDTLNFIAWCELPKYEVKL